jgi:hypothetical protein
MLRSLIIAALLVASPASASPKNDASIAAARAAVAEMQRLAKTPAERELANRDHMIVEKAAALVAERDAALAQGKQLEETQMSFNMQYLGLQSEMQHENRSYTAVSNIMKTKHDTVKNSISNVR